jgi:hypothetical protein
MKPSSIPYYPGMWVEVRIDDKTSLTDSVILVLTTRIPKPIAAEHGQGIIDAILEAVSTVAARGSVPECDPGPPQLMSLEDYIATEGADDGG